MGARRGPIEGNSILVCVQQQHGWEAPRHTNSPHIITLHGIVFNCRLLDLSRPALLHRHCNPSCACVHVIITSVQCVQALALWW